MLRPSTERGMPALGCADRGREVTARTRSMASSMATGPTLQLMPSTSTLHSVKRGGESFGVGAIQAIAVFVNRDLGDDGNLRIRLRIHVAAGEHGLMQLFQVAKRFEHQQIDATFDQGLDLLAESRAGLFERSLAQRLDANAERTNRSGDPDVETLGRLASHVRARHIDVAHPVGQAVPRQAKLFAPKVLVSIISAPACR